MSLIDLILNLAALLLWLNWRAIDFETISSPRVSIVSNLKKLNRSPSRWIFLGILAAVLCVRAIIYWQLGPALDWVAKIPLGPITLSFRSDYWWRIFLYSFLSFGVVLAIFYLGLLLLSVVNCRVSDADPMQKLVRLHLGWIEPLPIFVKLLLPLLFGLVLWVCLRPILLGVNLVPATTTVGKTVQQGLVIGVNAYFVWRYYILIFLFLYVLNSYIYFGAAPIWGYISQTGRRLISPLGWLPLQFGRFDFTPMIAMIAVFFATKYAAVGLDYLYRRFTV